VISYSLQNIFPANNVATLRTVDLLILHLLNCIIDTIQVTDGRKRFPWGSHVGQPWSLHCRLAQPVARGQHVPATKRYTARKDNWNERTSFSSFLDKAETERPGNFEHLWAVYLWRYAIHY